jgi:hypothetical protein
MLFEFVERAHNFFVGDMSVHINKEEIFPRLLFRGTALNLAHVDLQPLEGFERAEKGAGFVLDPEHDRGLVVARRRTCVLADNEKPCRVLGTVLDRPLEDAQLVNFRRHPSGQRGRAFFFRRQLRRARRARDLDQIRPGKVLAEPLAALAEHLRMRVKFADLLTGNVRE